MAYIVGFVCGVIFCALAIAVAEWVAEGECDEDGG